MAGARPCNDAHAACFAAAFGLETRTGLELLTWLTMMRAGPVANLLPACKNIGTTRVTNGAYREHQTEWSIGKAAGLLAAFALQRRTATRAVCSTAALLADFQRLLQRQGVMLAWPRFGALTPTLRTRHQTAR